MTTYIKRKKDLIWKEIDSQIIILDVEKNFIYELNTTAGFIWRLTSRFVTKEYIVNKLISEYETKESLLKKEVNEFVVKNKSLFDFKES